MSAPIDATTTSVNIVEPPFDGVLIVVSTDVFNDVSIGGATTEGGSMLVNEGPKSSVGTVQFVSAYSI